jgi:hypothetical protein
MWLTTLCLLLTAEGDSPNQPTPIKESPAATKPADKSIADQNLSQVSLELSALLKREAGAKTPVERSSAILALTEMYGAMMRDKRQETHVFLHNMRFQLRGRLVHVRDDLKAKIAGEERRAGKKETPVLDEEQIALRHSLASSLAMSDRSLASPTMMFNRGGGFVDDTVANGRALIELIERTINPDFWDTNGGPGVIIYYAPLQCLVVLATGSTHEQIGGLLDAVR